MSLALEGTLDGIQLGDLLRLIARERRSGVLRVTVDGVPFRFSLRAGQLIDATVGEEGEPAEVESTLVSLVRHRRGAFQLAPGEVEAGPEDDGRTGVNAEALAAKGDMALLQLSERLDAAGGEGSTPSRDAFPTPKQMGGLDPDARRIYALVDGERTVAELILRSRLDPARALAALETLSAQSLVKLAEAMRGDDPAAQARGSGPPGARWGDLAIEALAAAVPLLLLLAWLGWVVPSRTPEPSAPFAIRRDPLAAARAAYDVERLRAAVQAHRFAEGRWPERLAALAERGYVPPSALTDAQGRPYYYAAREHGFVLLAPER
jgi:hypothetical protein